MRSMLLAIALLVTTGCAGSLKHHAQAASASSQVIAGVGDVIAQEAAQDVAELAGLPDAEHDQKLAALKKRWLPVEVAYAAAQDAHAAYMRAIVEANANGQKTLGKERVLLLKDAWTALLEAAEHMGINVPTPPEILERLLGGES